MVATFKILGTPDVTDELKQTIVDGVLEMAGNRSVDQLAQTENKELLGLIKLRAKKESAPTTSTAETTATGANGSATERLFFLDVSGGRIESLNTDGSDRRVVLDGLKRIPDGIGIDEQAGHIYWTNMGNPKANDGSIERADLDGGNRTTIVPPGATFTPKQLTLDRKARKVYWSDREGMRVMRANFDGSQIETLVDRSEGDQRPGRDETKWCVGIAVDHDAGQIYWTQKGADNAGEGGIFRANLEIPKGENPTNRTDIEVLFNGLPEPIDLELDLSQQMIYWTDRGNPPQGNTVSRARLKGESTEANRQEILVSDLMEGIGLALDTKHGRMFFSDLAGSVYSARLDGSDKKALLMAQGNLTGVAYADLAQTKAAAARTDGPRLIP
jgi:hypothetical protein